MVISWTDWSNILHRTLMDGSGQRVSGCSLCSISTNQDCCHQCFLNRLESASGLLKVQGPSLEQETSLHISIPKLHGIYNACQTCEGHIKYSAILILTENTITMYYMKKQWGAHADMLCQKAIWLWQFCTGENITELGSRIICGSL